MSVSLPTSSLHRRSEIGRLWPVHEESTQQSEKSPVIEESATASSNGISPSNDKYNILQCCKDDDSRNGTCCRDLKPSDQRTLIHPDDIRDIIIGLSDGLTVPFALTAGLSSVGSSRFVVLAGVAELISGAISMGVGGFLSTQAEIEHYHFKAREVHQRVQKSCPKELTDEIADILEPYGAPYKVASALSAHLWQAEQAQNLSQLPSRPPVRRFYPWRRQSSSSSLSRDLNGQENDKGLTQFLVRVGGGLEPISTSRAYISALTIGFSYLMGGLVPLLPYIIIHNVHTALFVSIGVTAGLLVVFGIVKQHYSGARTGIKGYTYGAISTLLVGSMAAAASWGIVRAIESHGSNMM